MPRSAPGRPLVSTRRPPWLRPGPPPVLTLGDIMIVLLVLAPAIVLLIARR